MSTTELLTDLLEVLEPNELLAVYLRFWGEHSEYEVGEFLFSHLSEHDRTKRRDHAHDLLRRAMRRMRRRAGVL